MPDREANVHGSLLLVIGAMRKLAEGWHRAGGLT